MRHLIARGRTGRVAASGCLGVLLAAAWSGVGFPAAVVGQTGQPGGTATFLVLLRGAEIGRETVRVARTDSGWVISSSGQQLRPIDLVTTKFEMTYGADWQPQALSIEGLLHGQLITLATTFGPTSATSAMLQGGRNSSVTQPVSPRTVVLPNNFYGAYEALAARLGSVDVGMSLPLYIAPQAEVTATVTRVTPRRVAGPSGAIDFRQFDLTIANPTGPVAVEVWIDANNRLARAVIASGSVVVVRDDIASVMTREEAIRNAADTDVFIPAAGSNLAATVTAPSHTVGRAPAVVLVSGWGPADRDETMFGVPVFGQLAGAIADAGCLVVRYDKRGVGQSGGRAEEATIADYADDIVSVIDWLRARKDVDEDRIAVVGYGEGGAVALLVGSGGHHVAAIGLVAAAGQTGREIVLWQQQHALDKLNLSASDREVRIALQQRILNAVVKGTGWETVTDDLRYRADTPWFKSWILFDPAVAIAKIHTPILILHGSLDMQMPVAQADRLEALSRSRKKTPAADTHKVVIAGVNHLLVPAQTGEVGEYGSLPVKAVSPAVALALTDWLKDVLAPRKH
jgi:pimeloyl-ACP methyl ester carboxylesterase